jgi:hypothetical protein
VYRLISEGEEMRQLKFPGTVVVLADPDVAVSARNVG